MIAALLLQQTVLLGSLWGDYLKTMVILAVICLLALGALKFLRPRLQASAGSSGGIRVLARQSLEPRKNLYVVRAGHTTMLIATSGESVHFMTLVEHTDFPEEQTADAGLSAKPMFQKITHLVKDR